MSRAVLSRRTDPLPPELAGAAAIGAPREWRAQPQSGKVVNVDDPDSRGRVQVELLSLDPSGDTQVWARVATGFAGDNYGMFALPGIDEEVMVVFLGGDPAHPVVVGALWNGNTELPEEQPSGDVKVWGLAGRAGCRMAIDESSEGSEIIALETPSGVKIELKDGGNSIELINGSMKITMSDGNIDIESAAQVNISSSKVTVDAPLFECSAGFSQFSGVVQCDTLITNSVVSSAYTPGAGNIW